MCKLSAETDTPHLENRKRRKLWEVPPSMHCSILGTCLGHADLIKITRKTRSLSDENITEYQLHSFCVQHAEEPCRLSRQMHKVLDAKYQPAISFFRAAHSEAELSACWSSALAKGEIAGAYWALMTHPMLTNDLLNQAFGEVHMLSHLTSTTYQDATNRLGKAENELNVAKRRLNTQVKENQRLIVQNTEALAAIRRQLKAVLEENTILQSANIRLCENQHNSSELRTIKKRNSRLEVKLRNVQLSETKSRQRCAHLEQKLSTLRVGYDKAIARIEALENECLALEATVKSSLCKLTGPTESESITDMIDLRGQRVAYIGGRASAIGHFRTIIKNLNGSFSHHDGGVEDNIKCLSGILGQADVVLCPIDCISHDACLQAKTFCKKTAKPFVPLRTAGLSSFVSGLQRAIGENQHHVA